VPVDVITSNIVFLGLLLSALGQNKAQPRLFRIERATTAPPQRRPDVAGSTVSTPYQSHTPGESLQGRHMVTPCPAMIPDRTAPSLRHPSLRTSLGGSCSGGVTMSNGSGAYAAMGPQ